MGGGATVISAHAPHSVATRPAGWLNKYIEEFDNSADYVAEGLAIDVIEDALSLMEQEDVSRADLARLMQVKPAYISRIFNAPPNMTLRTIAQIAIALGTRPHIRLHPTCLVSMNKVHEEDAQSDSNLRISENDLKILFEGTASDSARLAVP
jgi:plasmid maintenance system antidote protein VapI